MSPMLLPHAGLPPHMTSKKLAAYHRAMADIFDGGKGSQERRRSGNAPLGRTGKGVGNTFASAGSSGEVGAASEAVLPEKTVGTETTVMLKNIPEKYTREALIELLRLAFGGRYQ